MERRRCILYENRSECIECGDCSICDLDQNKICDNCGKCIGLGDGLEYRAIMVDGIITADMNPSDYLYEPDEPCQADEQDNDSLVWP